ncbi:hypothetical protein BDV95DRAFT_605745 [Massariosphaeria phaeospora]|uniref:Phosphatidylglycerol/phosphatidylinositol transfer protein n=1 Tax=Massariosphaeria phaeospora TaxID=100035 RepID=A0A7C8MC34_9PLEO|nr:hypothetical protein BDV95DRAFT_605745 [Massariosphaeria phaeospora]
MKLSTSVYAFASLATLAHANFDLYDIVDNGWKGFKVLDAEPRNCAHMFDAPKIDRRDDVSGNRVGVAWPSYKPEDQSSQINRVEMHFQNVQGLYHWTIYGADRTSDGRWPLKGVDDQVYGECFRLPLTFDCPHEGDDWFDPKMVKFGFFESGRHFRCLTEITADQINASVREA